MNPLILWAGAFTAAAVFGVVGGLVMYLTTSQVRVSSRVRQFVASDAPPAVASIEKTQKRKRAELFAQISERWNPQRASQNQALIIELDRADVRMTPSEFGLVRIAV